MKLSQSDVASLTDRDLTRLALVLVMSTADQSPALARVLQDLATEALIAATERGMAIRQLEAEMEL